MPGLPFVGRADLLAEIGDALADARSGHGGLVALTGAAGAGKTRVAEEAVRAAEGFRVIWAWCPPGEAGSALRPWSQVARELAAGAAACGRLVQGSPGLRALIAGRGPVGPPAEGAPSVRAAGGEDAALAAILRPAGSAPEPGPDLTAGPDLALASDLAPGPAAARLRLAGDLAALVRAGAAAGALLLVVDDLHEADASSVTLLLELAAAVRTDPVLLLATARDEDSAWQGRTAALAALLRTARCLPVGPLGEPEVRTLARAATGGRPDPASVRELLARTGGDAFFVTELLRRPGDGPVPVSVRAAVQARVAVLAPECARVLGAASALGAGFDLDVLAEVAAVPLADLRPVLGQAVGAGLLNLAEPGRGAFRHQLTQEAVHDALPVGERAGWHHRAAEVLAGLAGRGRDVGPAEVAHQLLLAGPEHARSAADFARRAGARAYGLLAYEDAVRWYEAAVAALASAGAAEAPTAAPDPSAPVPDLAAVPTPVPAPAPAPDVAELLAELLVDLGTARIGAGERAKAREDFLRAAALARRRARPDLLARAALGLGAGPAGFEVGLLDRTQLDLLAEARATLPPARADLLAAVAARLSVAATLVEPEQDRTALAEEAVRTARAGRDDQALAYALAALCDARAGPVYCAERLDRGTEIVRLARRLPDPSAELLGRRLRVVALLELGRAAEAEQEVLAFEVTATALGQPLHAWYVPLWQGMRALLEGRFEDCRDALDRVAALGRRAGSENAELLAATQRWCLLAETGDRAGIRSLAERLSLLDVSLGLWPRVTKALIAAQLGEPAEARRRLAAVAPLLATAPRDSEWLPMLAQAAEVLGLTGPAGELAGPARQLYDWLAPYADLFVVEGIGAAVRGPVHRHLGLLAAALGESAPAERHFTAALAAARAVGATGLAGRIAQEAGARPPPAGGNVFRRAGEGWELRFAGRQAMLADSKGLHDLAVLLARPGRPVPALDLVTAGAGPAGARGAARGPLADRGTIPGANPDGLHPPGDTGELIDATARQAYRTRLRELEQEETEADRDGDADRSARIAVERQALVGQLAAAYGLGGRPRRTGSAAERARTTVTARIRAALDRITRAHPPLGRHLANAVRTGTLCVYDPESPVGWQL
ncbi:ATP-binding protein [Kitasatospora herbaricolor]|uniref:AAA family ATPase n=1 Tax=Kitasatospora herbaricolor TaxID=68217 RepID=A0ABZ1W3D9_9ACTN|nr:AAA family ATPase [Kitasatospora herbaricolor]